MIDAVVTKFGLARMPSGRDLPPSRLHRHRDCGEAAARIAWAVADKTIGMVTGEVGTGKTAAIRAAAADVDPASHTVIYVGNPSTGVRGILAHVVTALGGKPVHGTAALAVQAWNVLAGEAAERGRTPVLVIDEAHLLDHEQLESIRLMTNHDMDLLTELPGLSSQFSGQVRAGGVTVPDHDRIRGVWPGPRDDPRSSSRGAAGDRRSVGALPAGRSGR
jgi:type II secretory pathway predicted ATPase ExeA